MDVIGVVASVVYQFCTNAAFLLLCALGLIVILGMMNIINLAHGELMMMGAYTASASYSRGAPFWLAAIIAFVAVGIFGAVLEATIVRRFYGRELGALVVTWGVSLVLSQGFLLLFGPFMPPIQIPGGNRRARPVFVFVLLDFHVPDRRRCSSSPFGGFTTARTSASRRGRPCKIRRWRERSGSTRAAST